MVILTSFEKILWPLDIASCVILYFLVLLNFFFILICLFVANENVSGGIEFTLKFQLFIHLNYFLGLFLNYFPLFVSSGNYWSPFISQSWIRSNSWTASTIFWLSWKPTWKGILQHFGLFASCSPSYRSSIHAWWSWSYPSNFSSMLFLVK